MSLTVVTKRIEDEFYHVHKYCCDDEKWNKGEVINTKTFSRCIIKSSEEPLKGLAEYDYEKIRKKDFSDYPSRLSCAFFFMEKTDALVFRNEIMENAQVVKISLLQGKYVKCDQNIINKWMDGTKQTGRDEYEYWSGMASDNPLWEVLFEGCFVVEEIIR